jgi:hypothetical protein
MVSLSQVEPRTPISQPISPAMFPIGITQAGSYYLTGNITVSSGDAIVIRASGVTLDLNGFTISSTDPNNTGAGIVMVGVNIHVLNGNVTSSVSYNSGTGVYSGAGFGYGVLSDFAGTTENLRVSGVSVVGCLFSGIDLGLEGASTVESWTVNTVGGVGIEADSVANSAALLCGGEGINATTANNCYGYSPNVVGLTARMAENCFGQSLSGDGLDAFTAENCYGSSFGGAGIGLNASYTAQNCLGASYSGTGLNATTAENCYGTSTSGDGLDASSAGNCYGVSSSATGLNAAGGIS